MLPACIRLSPWCNYHLHVGRSLVRDYQYMAVPY